MFPLVNFLSAGFLLQNNICMWIKKFPLVNILTQRKLGLQLNNSKTFINLIPLQPKTPAKAAGVGLINYK
ncbi:hypothetical protein DYI25_17025 [Mesobacillus boroniphilus]|uniref:Uncharacterized protein n=1 Tax=Mesobacillus boroniphilus TaxID=308892 RepID=A0A944CQV5_9BACI|nr:hypothetical protein [Mesobacillus boroniphilus]